MVSGRIREALAQIACREDDGAGGELVAAWGDIRIGAEDADELLAAVEMAEWVVGLVEAHGVEKAWALLRMYVRLLAVPSTVETLQMMVEADEKWPT